MEESFTSEFRAVIVTYSRSVLVLKVNLKIAWVKFPLNLLSHLYFYKLSLLIIARLQIITPDYYNNTL